jgi:hypothetical protein
VTVDDRRAGVPMAGHCILHSATRRKTALVEECPPLGVALLAAGQIHQPETEGTGSSCLNGAFRLSQEATELLLEARDIHRAVAAFLVESTG